MAIGRRRQAGSSRSFFSCEGLICTNPLYFERNREKWHSTLMPNGVDPARFSPGPQRKADLGLPTDRPLVLMVSALEPGKRVIEAMHAMADVPDATLVVAGDGPLRDEVDKLAAAILPGRFMRATFNHDQMPDLYRSADLFLHTKIRESFGNVYIEALSCGMPVVAHDDEVTRWIFDGRATLVDTDDRALLGKTIAEALRTPYRVLRRRHGRMADSPGAVIADKYVEFFRRSIVA